MGKKVLVPEFTENCRGLLEGLFKISEVGLLKALGDFISNKYSNVEITEDYVYAEGNIPVMLIAHVDTVFRQPIRQFTYNEKRAIYKGKEGLGADDRAGVFAIIQILRKKYRPYVLFTTDEEMGGYGAHIFVEAHPVAPNIKYMIELDRAGERDCVFYECENFTFMDYVESFGFKQAIGSFTDISIIMPEWEVAGVNLSVGYHHEHTQNEDLHIRTLYNTINKVCKMLDDIENANKYKFIPSKEYLQWITLTNKYHMPYDFDDDKLLNCSFCNQLYYEWEDFPLDIDGVKVHVCSECLALDPNIHQCEKCYNLFYSNNMKERVCDKCRVPVVI